LTRRCRRKPHPVVGIPHRGTAAGGVGVVTVYEIKSGAVRYTTPKPVRPRLAHPIPAHVRHLERKLRLARRLETPHASGQNAETRRAAALLARLVQRLQPEA